MAQHDDPSLEYADYFATGGGALVPEAEPGDEDGLYGAVHQHEAGMFGVRGLVTSAEMAAAAGSAHGKQAELGDFFVLGDHAQQHHHQAPFTALSLHGPPDAASLMLHHQQEQLGGGVPRHYQHQHQAAWPQPGAWHLRGSRFLLPAQQLLQEFCNLPVETTTASKPPTKQANEDGGSSSSAPSAQIQAMDAAELHRLKAKLYAMLEEVDRRYRRYREQMRAVAGSFEAVAGERAAAGYTRLASRTISRHFRNLRNGVAAQMQAVRGALGEKDTAGGVTPKAETTPRLRALDQCLRQHRAFQTGVLQSQPWRPQRGLPERAVSILRAWLFEHFLHPYPSDVDKHILSRQTGLSRSQVSNWFINARVRLWKPMVEDMYTEEMKDEGSGGSGAGSSSSARNPNPSSYASEGRCRGKEEGGSERKPTQAQLLRDAGSLASVVSVGNNRYQNVGFGMVDDDHLDFDAYDVVDGHAPADGNQGFGGGGGGVSLTLGLQQHAGDDPHGAGGVNVAFAGAPAHEFLFMAGGEQQMVASGGGVHTGGHGHHGAGGEAVSHYHRGLGATGFQFLHDLAG